MRRHRGRTVHTTQCRQTVQECIREHSRCYSLKVSPRVHSLTVMAFEDGAFGRRSGSDEVLRVGPHEGTTGFVRGGKETQAGMPALSYNGMPSAMLPCSKRPSQTEAYTLRLSNLQNCELSKLLFFALSWVFC